MLLTLSSIEIFGVLINEPGTFISDLIMGLACLLIYFKMSSKCKTQQQRFLSYFFLFFAISSVIASFAHGFYYIFGKVLHVLSWSFSGFAVYFILAGSENMIENQNLKSIYRIFNIFQLSLLILLILISPSFNIVKISFAFALAGILLPLYIVDTIRNSYKTNFYIFLGILIAAIPALFHTVEFQFWHIFNMNDLSHFMLIFCYYFVYLGIQKRFFNTENLSTVTEKKSVVNVKI